MENLLEFKFSSEIYLQFIDEGVDSSQSSHGVEENIVVNDEDTSRLAADQVIYWQF